MSLKCACLPFLSLVFRRLSTKGMAFLLQNKAGSTLSDLETHL